MSKGLWLWQSISGHQGVPVALTVSANLGVFPRAQIGTCRFAQRWNLPRLANAERSVFLTSFSSYQLKVQCLEVLAATGASLRVDRVCGCM